MLIDVQRMTKTTPMDDERLLDLLIEHAVEQGSLLAETIPALHGKPEHEVRAYCDAMKGGEA